jgi:serine/threonine protein kinase
LTRSSFFGKYRKILIVLFPLLWAGAILVGYGLYGKMMAEIEARLADRSAASISADGFAVPLLDRTVGELGHLVAQRDISASRIRTILKQAAEENAGRMLFMEALYLDEVAPPVSLARFPEFEIVPRKRIPLSPPEGMETSELWFLPEGRLGVSATVGVYFSGLHVGRLVGLFAMEGSDPTPAYRNYLLAWIFPGAPLCVLALFAAGAGAARYGAFREARSLLVGFWAVRLYHLERDARHALFVAGVIGGLVDRLRRDRAKRTLGEKERRIGPYRILEKLGQGGMAEIFVAEHARQEFFRKTVALKRILPHLADDPEFIDRFVQEARLAALLDHPNVVRTWDFHRDENDSIIVMEFVRGKNLAEIMAGMSGPMSMDQAVFILLQIGRGLHYSHSRRDDRTGEPLRIVHRDVSPQNIMVSFDGEVKISDFGIARAGVDAGLTHTGAFVGKLNYAAPEQIRGEWRSVDNRTDIYSVGIIAYELLTGSPLYRFKSFEEAFRTITEEEIPPLRSRVPDVPSALDRIVSKALEKDPAARYRNAGEFVDDLEALRRDYSYPYGMSDLSRFMRKRFHGDSRKDECPPYANYWIAALRAMGIPRGGGSSASGE